MGSGGRDVRVLYVDDWPDRAESVAGSIEGSDDRFDVETAASATEGIARLADGRFDCVVSDHDPFGHDGIGFLKAVREEHPEVPRIVYTARGSEEAASEAISAGVTDYLQRDSDGHTALADRIADLVEERRSPRGAAADGKRRQYETIVEALGDPVYVLDDTGSFTYVNDAFLDLVGYDREGVLGSEPSLVKDQAAIETAERHLGRLLSSSGPESITFEVDIQPSDGDPVPCEDHMGVLPYDGAEFEGSAGVLRNVSDRQEREQELRDEREFVEQCLGALDDVFYVVDREGRLERWNDKLETVTGHEDEELAGRPVTDFFPADEQDRIEAAIEDILETGGTKIRAEFLTAAGDRVPHEFTGERLTNSDGEVTGFVGIGREITDQLEYEHRLERTNERLEEFASLVSHDLRNPLNIAQSRLELAREELDSEHFSDIAWAHDRMETLIEDILTLARQGEDVDATEPVSIGHLAEECWETVLTEAATVEIDDPPTILADRSRVAQLLENLIRNAVEHGSTSPDEDARQDAVDHAGPDVTVTIGRLADGFYLEDDGPGIDTVDREDVLEAGYTTDEDGTGFGLSIVRQIAEAHDWRLSIAESADGGARFEFTNVELAE